MEYTQSDAALIFHRNPAYWDGYILGQTGPDTVKSTVSHRPADMLHDVTGALAASRELRAHLNDMHTYWPDQTLGPGEVFDPNDHAPFTVIALSKEVIRVREEARGKIPGHPGILPTSDAPRVVPNLHHNKTSFFSIATPSFKYTAEGQWGVVTEGRHGNRITTVMDLFVSREHSAKVAPLFSSHSTPDVIPVGEVLGEFYSCKPGKPSDPTPSPNHFQRFNHVDVFDFGAPRRGQKVLKKILSKLAIGELPPQVSGA